MSEEAKKAAKEVLKEIRKQVKRLRWAREKGNDEEYDRVMEKILNSALEVSVRSTWWAPVGQELKPNEYRILLMWGGPAVHITGELDDNGEPYSARLEYQDWYEPWQEYSLDAEALDDLLEFAKCFYYVID